MGIIFFYGQGIVNSLIDATKLKVGSIIFGYHVHDPKRYGVVEIEQNSNKVLSIEEIAYRLCYIDKRQTLILAEKFSKSGYGDYIKMIVNENDNKIIENY